MGYWDGRLTLGISLLGHLEGNYREDCIGGHNAHDCDGQVVFDVFGLSFEDDQANIEEAGQQQGD